MLIDNTLKSCAAKYLKILCLAAKVSEVAVDSALMGLINENQEISIGAVERLIESNAPVSRPDDVHIQDVDLTRYDQLLKEAAA